MNERELAMRITVLDPPPGVTFCVQRGKTDLVPPTRVSDGHVSFDFTLRPNLRGPFAQGPPAGRFVYVNSGTLAGQADSCWTRRAKVPLSGITWELIEQTLSAPNAVLEARIQGTAKDGGPACATVPLVDGGWRVVRHG
jgi:Family of unknown function (DUF5990)